MLSWNRPFWYTEEMKYITSPTVFQASFRNTHSSGRILLYFESILFNYYPLCSSKNILKVIFKLFWLNLWTNFRTFCLRTWTYLNLRYFRHYILFASSKLEKKIFSILHCNKQLLARVLIIYSRCPKCQSGTLNYILTRDFSHVH